MQRDVQLALDQQEQEPPLTAYELSLAEFPLFLLSKHPIPGLDAITYTDTITVQGNPVPRTWRVTWSKKYGPASQSAAETFFALYQMWADADFQSPWIHFGSIRSIMRRRGISPGVRAHERILHDLHCLTNVYIEAKNAFYDSEKRKYVDASFHLFETLVLEKDSEGNPDPSSRGHIRAHPILHAAARKNTFQLGIPEARFFALPGIQQRLYLYLRKMLTFQKFHTRSLADLASQIPLYSVSHKRAKQQIKNASQAILDADLIPSLAKYRIYTSPAGTETIRFVRADATQTSLFEQVTKQDTTETNFSLITEFCKDEHSFPFYQKAAALLTTDDICRAISEVKEFANDLQRQGGSLRNLPAHFTSRLISIAKERGIELHNS